MDKKLDYILYRAKKFVKTTQGRIAIGGFIAAVLIGAAVSTFTTRKKKK